MPPAFRPLARLPWKGGLCYHAALSGRLGIKPCRPGADASPAPCSDKKFQVPMVELAKEIQPVSIEAELRQSYLDYAMSVIVGRALPDVRDGLKPVHRRVLFAMSVPVCSACAHAFARG